VLQQERQNISENKVQNINDADKKMQDDLEKHKAETAEMVRQMTTTYRAMERDLQNHIEQKQKAVEIQEQTKNDLKQEIAELNKRREVMIMDKDAEIRKLKEQLDEVSSDFANLLKNQLNKFQQRVVQGHQSFEMQQDATAADEDE